MKKGGDLRTIRRKTRNTIRDITNFARRITLDPDSIVAKRRYTVMPPQMRRILERIGNESVTSLHVFRVPVSAFVRTLMNVLSLGEYQRAVQQAGYDNMFHLGLWINRRYILDKQDVLKLVEATPSTGGEMKEVTISQTPSISQLLERTRQRMGDKAFTSYDANHNNCQDFVSAVLESNGLMTEELRAFIKQDADAVFQRMPSITSRLSSFLTDVGAVANKLVYGAALKKYSNWNFLKKNAVKYGIDPSHLHPSTRKGKKWVYAPPDKKPVHFGASESEDYLKHRDPIRLQRFQTRNARWKDSPKGTASWLSYYLLWT